MSTSSKSPLRQSEATSSKSPVRHSEATSERIRPTLNSFSSFRSVGSFNESPLKSSMVHAASAIHERAKIKNMRDRFNALQLEGSQSNLELLDEDSGEVSLAVPAPSTEQHHSHGLDRWSMLRSIIKSSKGKGVTQMAAPEVVPPSVQSEQMMDFWLNSAIPPAQVDVFPEDIVLDIEPPPYVSDLVRDADPLSVVVSRVPESIVQEQKQALDRAVLEEKERLVQAQQSRELDVIWREHLARERIMELERSARERLEQERVKLAEARAEKDKHIARSFRRAREELEASLAAQNASVMEKYGEVTVHDKSLARRYHVKAKSAPQPIEMRIHFMRAVKTKLPKGAYVIMLTQYESLGGKPLAWSKTGLYGIGPSMPAVTKPVKHYGRFFDRVVRFEDSCFALCPPVSTLKPSYVFVLELFQLANNTCPTDRVVAWTAMPMCGEHLGHVEGKYKLPLMRGEHSPAIRHFRKMDAAIGQDLNNWLCNIYLEIKHLPLSLIEDNKAVNPSDLEYDFLSKNVLLNAFYKKEQEVADKKNETDEADLESGLGRVTAKDSIDIPGLFHRKGKPSSINPVILTSGRGKASTDIPPLSPSEEKRRNGQSLSATNLVGSLSRLLSVKGSRVGVSRGTDEYHIQGGMRVQLPRGEDERASPTTMPLLLETKTKPEPLPPTQDAVVPATDFVDPIDREHHDIHISEHSDEDDVVERGYEQQDEFFLDGQQKGKLMGIESIDDVEGAKWAKSAQEGNINRRWQSDGIRLDREAVPHPDAVSKNGPPLSPIHKLDHAKSSGISIWNSNKSMVKKSASSFEWVDLTDEEDMELYTPAVAADPSQRRRLLPGALSKSKLKYLYLEVFGEMSSYMWGTFDFYVTVMVYLIALWLRVYIHYVAEYLLLLSLKTPVYGFNFELVQVSFKYMSLSISIGSEVGVVAIGPIANIIFFSALAIAAHYFYKLAGFLPKGLSTFIAAYGLAMVLDPVLVLVVDLASHNYSCSSSSAECQVSYTGSACKCFNGDFIKLWLRTQQTEGSGLTGLLLVIIIYGGCAVLSFLCLYEYLVYVHHDGRILDIWRRINGMVEEFLMPDDFEISHEELRSISIQASKWRGLDGKTRKLIISEYVEHDELDLTFEEKTKHYVIYEIAVDGKKSVYRHFLELPNGAIVEIFDQFATSMASKTTALHKLLKIDQQVPFMSHISSANPLHSQKQAEELEAAAKVQSHSAKAAKLFNGIDVSAKDNSAKMAELAPARRESKTSPRDVTALEASKPLDRVSMSRQSSRGVEQELSGRFTSISQKSVIPNEDI